jgi:predicted HTH transcriptional regulator
MLLRCNYIEKMGSGIERIREELDYTDKDSPPLGIGDYDQVKLWLFDLLESSGADQRLRLKLRR